MYVLLGMCLALVVFLSVNALVSFTAALAWRLAERPPRRSSARTRAEILFALRVTPPVLALIAVGFFFVPAYVNYEPRATSEVVSAKLAAFAIVSAFGVVFAGWRSGRALLATRALRRKWIMVAYEIHLPGIDVPTFRLAHSFPIIAVIGTMQPRLFIADKVLQSLNVDELAAAFAHEYGHLRARDNLKRGLLSVCRDALIVPFGRSLDRSWAAAAEAAADESAARTSPDVALNLASALVRIARMVPLGARAEMPLAAFLVGDETRGIKVRVRRLLEIASTNRSEDVSGLELNRTLPLISLILALVFASALASNGRVLLTVHAFVERVVAFLS